MFYRLSFISSQKVAAQVLINDQFRSVGNLSTTWLGHLISRQVTDADLVDQGLAKNGLRIQELVVNVNFARGLIET